MCIPHPQSAPPPPSDVSSMQAASSLTLANAGPARGAAQLGRLALRIGGDSSAQAAAASSPTQQTVKPSVAAPATVQGFGATPATSAPYGGVGTTPGSLAGLRFGNYNAAFV